MKEITSLILMIIGIGAMVLAQITGIGYFLYEMAHSASFGVAAWAGFVLWIQLMVGGVISTITGIFIGNS